MQNKGFDYYAFISYNHKDAKWAKQLQRQLEHYRLPSALYKEQPELPKRITPVFLDSSDLVARSSLLESLQAKLDASNYLIVLCSPNSATGVSLAWENPPSMRFYYGTSDGFDGRVVTQVVYYDLYGQELYEKRYSADLSAVDFVQSGNSSPFSR